MAKKKGSKSKPNRPARASLTQRKRFDPAPALDRPQSKARKVSKQHLILGMLNAPEGATIAAIMEETGWQAHSVRAFFASVVRKALALNLGFEMKGGQRVYRISVLSCSPDRATEA